MRPMPLHRYCLRSGVVLSLASSMALAACNDEPTPPYNETFPAIAMGDNSCTRVDTLHVPVATWMAAADEFIYGTVESVTPIWDRNFLADGEPVYTACNDGFAALDVKLSDVVSIKTGREFSTMTVRIGGPTLKAWADAGYTTGSYGASAITWSVPTDAALPLQPGSSLGGAIYTLTDSVSEEVYNVLLGHNEPLFSVDAKQRISTQEFTHTDCLGVGGTVAEGLMSFNHLPLSKLQTVSDLLEFTDFPTNGPELYRQQQGLGNFLVFEKYFGGLCTEPDPV